jgi:6-phosphofructokinase 2
MIYTVTLNPALDRELVVDKIVYDDANRVREEHRYAGGKGIDVARVLTELGVECVALGFVGGYDGLELEGRLINQGVACDFVRIGAETRTNIFVRNRKTGKQAIFSVRGPEVKAQDVGLLVEKLRNLRPAPTYAVIAGSLPTGVTPRIYFQLVKTLRDQGARVVLDADGEPLRFAIPAQPHIIKPNIHEFGRLMGKTIEDEAEIAAEARKLVDRGIELVIISLGSRGLLGVTADTIYRVRPPVVQVRSTIGSGDSVIAGLIMGLSRGKSLGVALRLGAAAGTATALTPGTELCHRADVDRILSQVSLEEQQHADRQDQQDE